MRLDPDFLVRKLTEHGGLTPAQAEAIKYILLGETLPRIAMRTGKAIRTAKFHRKEAFDKLGVTSTGGLWELLFEFAGHKLDPISKYPVRWRELFDTMGTSVSVDRVVRLTGRPERQVIKELKRHGYDIN